jgi:hypothetical protein
MTRTFIFMTACGMVLCSMVSGQTSYGLENHMASLFMLSDARTRSISPENLTGEKGRGGMATLEEGSAAYAARDLGRGWKVNPYIRIGQGETFTLAEIEGPGAIQHIWMTPAGNWRSSIIRFYWDDEEEPSVEVPVGDFFAAAWKYRQISSLAVCVNPGSAFNCYWIMPFRKKCRITMENLDPERMTLYYQIDYTLTGIPEAAAYFHAQFRRANPLTFGEVYTIVDQIRGQGHYVGTYLFWQSNNSGWWGEGEIKFYMDGDGEFPTICGTGTEDYFCGSYGFTQDMGNGPRYVDYTTPYAGFHVFGPDPDLLGDSQTRFGMYRWHITDPIRFRKDLKVTIQALGWRSGGRYLPLQDDISSVAFWYQEEPHRSFPELPDRDHLEIN